MEALNSHPTTFLHYEPFLLLKEERIAEKDLQTALTVIENLLHCEYNYRSSQSLFDWISAARKDKELITRNRPLRFCHSIGYEDCLEPNWMSQACKVFPSQIMKLVRLELRSTAKLLIQ